MNELREVAGRLASARGLAEVLAAALAALGAMLVVIDERQDRADGGYAAFVLAGTSVASSRLALWSAQSLPSLPGPHAVPAGAGGPAWLGLTRWRRWRGWLGCCRTHYYRNLLTKVPKSAQPWVSTLVRAIFEQPDAASVRAQVGVFQRSGFQRSAAADPGRCSVGTGLTIRCWEGRPRCQGW